MSDHAIQCEAMNDTKPERLRPKVNWTLAPEVINGIQQRAAIFGLSESRMVEVMLRESLGLINEAQASFYKLRESGT